MNNLSLLLYFANVLPSLASTLLFLVFLFAAIICVVSIFITVNRDCSIHIQADKYVDLRYKLLRYWPVVVLFLVTSILIPSERTFYFIAASELSEVVIEDGRVQKTFDSLSKIIDNKLESMLEENTTKNK